MSSVLVRGVGAAGSLVPEVEDPGLDDEPEQVLQGFEGRKQPLGQDWLFGMAHVVVQDFGELPEREETSQSGRSHRQNACWEIRTCRPAWR